MPQRDIYHEAVRNALIKDGWTITHDPYVLSAGHHNLYVTLSAEPMIAAERQDEQIAVKTKRFGQRPEVEDLEVALGHYALYDSLVAMRAPERRFFLAVPEQVFSALFESDLGQLVREDYSLRLMVFDAETAVVQKWQS